MAVQKVRCAVPNKRIAASASAESEYKSLIASSNSMDATVTVLELTHLGDVPSREFHQQARGVMCGNREIVLGKVGGDAVAVTIEAHEDCYQRKAGGPVGEAEVNVASPLRVARSIFEQINEPLCRCGCH